MSLIFIFWGRQGTSIESLICICLGSRFPTQMRQRRRALSEVAAAQVSITIPSRVLSMILCDGLNIMSANKQLGSGMVLSDSIYRQILGENVSGIEGLALISQPVSDDTFKPVFAHLLDKGNVTLRLTQLGKKSERRSKVGSISQYSLQSVITI